MLLRFNNKPICPYCSHKQEMADIAPVDGDKYDLECQQCEDSFEVETRIVVTYCTNSIDDEEFVNE